MARATLTKRELEILGEIARDGASDREIAERLGMTHSTARTQVSTILRKTQARNRTHLALWWDRLQRTA